MVSNSESLPTSIVSTVARSKGVAPTHLPPLYETVDPDALEALVASTSSDTSDDVRLSVRFAYAGRNVVVYSNGTVEVRKRSDDSDPSAVE